MECRGGPEGRASAPTIQAYAMPVEHLPQGQEQGVVGVGR